MTSWATRFLLRKFYQTESHIFTKKKKNDFKVAVRIHIVLYIGKQSVFKQIIYTSMFLEWIKAYIIIKKGTSFYSHWLHHPLFWFLSLKMKIWGASSLPICVSHFPCLFPYHLYPLLPHGVIKKLLGNGMDLRKLHIKTSIRFDVVLFERFEVYS